MSRMFPLLGSLLGSTPGRRRGGGAQGSFDFTTMNSAQLLAAGWSWTRDNAIWVPDAAGDYAEIAANVLAKSDLGVQCFGGFTNHCKNSIFSGFSAGTPGTWPGWVSDRASSEALSLRGIPGVKLTATGTVITTYSSAVAVPAVAAGLWRTSALCYGENVVDIKLMCLKNGSNRGSVAVTNTLKKYNAISNQAVIGSDSLRHGLYVYNATAVYFAGPQMTFGMALFPNVLALSSADTTITASQIPVLSRVTPGECSFVLPVVTSPGRKGTDDVIASASLDANNQLLVIHEEADNNILLRLVTAGSTVGEVDLGIVGDNVYTVISGSVAIGRLAGALEGMSEMIEVTGSGIIPPPAFMRWTLGNDHSQAAATQFWGSVSGLRIN